ERACQLLRLRIARAREGVDRTSLPMRDLGHDVAGCTKAVDADMLAAAGHHQRAPADQAGAEQGGQRAVVAGLAERKAVTGIGDQMRGKAAVACIAGEQRTVAEVFLSALAIGAVAAGPAQPGHADPRARDKTSDILPDGVDAADHLMSWHDGISN